MVHGSCALKSSLKAEVKCYKSPEQNRMLNILKKPELAEKVLNKSDNPKGMSVKFLV